MFCSKIGHPEPNLKDFIPLYFIIPIEFGNLLIILSICSLRKIGREASHNSSLKPQINCCKYFKKNAYISSRFWDIVLFKDIFNLLIRKTIYKGDYTVHQHCPWLKDLKGY